MQSERSASSRPHQTGFHKDIPDEALNDAMTEVRDAMTRYTTCPDPTESAARKERFRLAEEAGEVEETAALMILGTPLPAQLRILMSKPKLSTLQTLPESQPC
ncbi:Uncharacterized protein Rs2_43032 [Raphanus sativus]|nr:Uncharacterized protein Rs2_43032 [Raphanus sativus]